MGRKKSRNKKRKMLKAGFSKKSQLSEFVIIGAIILFSVGSLFFISTGISNSHGSDNSAAYFMKACLEQETSNILFQLGLTGGKLKEELLFTGVVAENSRSLLPTEKMLKESIAGYLNKSIISCIASFNSYKDIKIRKGKPSIKVIFTEKSIVVSIKSPYIITSKGKTHAIKEITIKKNVRLKTIRNAVAEIISSWLKSGYIEDNKALKTKGFVIGVIDKKSYLLWCITDYNSYLYNKPYRFIFAFRK